MKKSNQYTLGIDISSRTFDIFLREENGEGIHKQYENSSKGLSLCKKFLQKKNFQGQIVMESTGRYHFLVAIELSEAGHSVSVINPLLAKKYQTAQIRKCKTDKNDAKILAEVAYRENHLPQFSLSRSDVVIRQKISVISTLEKAIQKTKSSLMNYKKAKEEIGDAFNSEELLLEANIKVLQIQKERLEKEIVQAIESRSIEESTRMEILKSIPGVSEYLAALILYFFRQQNGQTVGSWVAFCGLEVSIAESGLWRGRGKISKRGNKYLRKRLFGGAWGGFMTHPKIKEYYYQLKENGRGHVEALNIISRKILRIAFFLLKRNEYFNIEKAF